LYAFCFSSCWIYLNLVYMIIHVYDIGFLHTHYTLTTTKKLTLYIHTNSELLPLLTNLAAFCTATPSWQFLTMMEFLPCFDMLHSHWQCKRETPIFCILM
jgi:hypothetical protein